MSTIHTQVHIFQSALLTTKLVINQGIFKEGKGNRWPPYAK